MLEKDLMKAVGEMAGAFGWMVFHARPAQSGKGWKTPVQFQGKGFPDLCCVRDRVVFIELKAGSNKLSPEQEAWADQILRSERGEWYLLTDKGWMAGEAEEILR